MKEREGNEEREMKSKQNLPMAISADGKKVYLKDVKYTDGCEVWKDDECICNANSLDSLKKDLTSILELDESLLNQLNTKEEIITKVNEIKGNNSYKLRYFRWLDPSNEGIAYSVYLKMKRDFDIQDAKNIAEEILDENDLKELNDEDYDFIADRYEDKYDWSLPGYDQMSFHVQEYVDNKKKDRQIN